MNKISITTVKSLQNPEAFAKVIHNNFLYLRDFPNLQHSLSSILILLKSHNTISYLVYHNKQLIGYLIGEMKHLEDGRLVFYISYVFVLKAYRSKGIGTQLINKIISDSKLKGIKFILLTCDSDDKRVFSYYLRIGFIEDPIYKSFDRHRVLTYYL